MDAFTIALIKGFYIKNKYNALKIASYFGFFQFFMTFLGFYVGNIFKDNVINYGKYITFFILFIIGLNMIIESKTEVNDKTNIKEMLILSFVTSIDAFTIGITFSLNDAKIIYNSIMIGVITFIISIIGALIGKKLKNIIKNKATIFGGIILIILSIKSLFI